MERGWPISGERLFSLETDGSESRTMNEFLRELAGILAEPEATVFGCLALVSLGHFAAVIRRGHRYPEQCHGER
jgi:hypothetical protein